MKKILALIPLFIALSVSAQHIDYDRLDMDKQAQKVTAQLELARNAANDSLRNVFAKNVDEELNILLGMDDDHLYPYDNLNPISVLTAPDNKFRIFTWGLQFSNGCYRYYGAVQINVHNDWVTLRLYDNSDETSNPATASMQSTNWYGAIYYELIQLGGKKSNIYALVGWDGGDLFVNRKVLEQVRLELDNGGEIFFGGNFIDEHKRNCQRLIFEYTERAVMSLRYDKRMKLFVADHLTIPPEYNGNPKYSGPDGSFDGYMYQKGMWIYIPDLDFKGSRF